MYSESLVPTDGGLASAAAVEQAVGLAEQFDARLHTLYVVDTTAYATLDAGAETALSILREEGEAALDGVQETAEAAGVSTVTELVSGAPHSEITDYAEHNGIDLIVMGTHGRTGLERYLLGSVTERVVRTAEMPVLTVRTTEDDND